MLALLIQGIAALSVMFSPTFVVFTVLRFVLGGASIGGLIAAFILSESGSLWHRHINQSGFRINLTAIE